MNYKKEVIEKLKKYEKRGINLKLESEAPDYTDTFFPTYHLILTKQKEDLFCFYETKEVCLLNIDDEEDLPDDEKLLDIILYNKDELFNWKEIYSALDGLNELIKYEMSSLENNLIKELNDYQILRYLKHRALIIE